MFGRPIFRRRRFTRRRFRRRRPTFKRATFTRGYINAAKTTLAFASTLGPKTIIQAVDTPLEGQEADLSTVNLECPVGSYIRKFWLQLNLAYVNQTQPEQISVLIYKDTKYGGFTDFTNARDEFLLNSDSWTIQARHASVIYFKTFLFSTQGDKINLSIRRIPKRLRTLKAGEAIKIIIQNHAAAAGTLHYAAVGKVVTTA